MKKEIRAIAAMNHEGIIGRNGTLPWHLPEDLRQFKELTLNTSVVMGRKTYQSLPCRLKGRETIIVTRDSKKTYEIIKKKDIPLVVNSIEEAIKSARFSKVMIAGGGEIYQLALPLVNYLYLTIVETQVDAGSYTFFPEVDYKNWNVLETDCHRTRIEGPNFWFMQMQRKAKR